LEPSIHDPDSLDIHLHLGKVSEAEDDRVGADYSGPDAVNAKEAEAEATGGLAAAAGVLATEEVKNADDLISGFDAQTISQRAISKTADGKVSVEGADYNNGVCGGVKCPGSRHHKRSSSKESKYIYTDEDTVTISCCGSSGSSSSSSSESLSSSSKYSSGSWSSSKSSKSSDQSSDQSSDSSSDQSSDSS